MNNKKMKKIVLGIGNPIIGDDGVGFHVIEALEAESLPDGVTVTACDVSGFAILDYIVDHDEAIIIDAIQTVNGKPGHVYRLELNDLRVPKHTVSPHDVGLPTALELGTILKLNLPHKVSIIAIEIPKALEFSTKLSREVSDAVPAAVQLAKQILKETV
jgi:hydrogenase maturation protease